MVASVSPRPSARERFVPLPIPIIKATAWKMDMAEKTTPTAAEASVLIWLTKYVSAILYTAVISMEMMVGMARRGIICVRGASSIICARLADVIF